LFFLYFSSAMIPSRRISLSASSPGVARALSTLIIPRFVASPPVRRAMGVLPSVVVVSPSFPVPDDPILGLFLLPVLAVPFSSLVVLVVARERGGLAPATFFPFWRVRSFYRAAPLRPVSLSCNPGVFLPHSFSTGPLACLDFLILFLCETPPPDPLPRGQEVNDF